MKYCQVHISIMNADAAWYSGIYIIKKNGIKTCGSKNFNLVLKLFV